jgi:phosphatidylserine synthase
VMVSTVPFRTFKAAKLDARTVAMAVLIVGSLVLLAVRVRPSFAVICLMGGYLAYGLGEWVVRGFGRLFEPADGAGAGGAQS